MKEGNNDRTEKLLALLLLQSMKGSTQQQKACQLSAADFTAVEIADMLDTSAGVIRQLLYTARRGKKKK